jgi:hypothetical protein
VTSSFSRRNLLHGVNFNKVVISFAAKCPKYISGVKQNPPDEHVCPRFRFDLENQLMDLHEI